MPSVTLSRPDDFDAWRDAARMHVLNGTPPDRLVWQVAGQNDLFGGVEAPAASATPPGQTLTVPRAFFDLARNAICHRDPERFALLYTMLWRIQTEPGLMRDMADPLHRRIADLAKAVRRDSHKMHAFVRFRELPDANAPDGVRFVAWFEPDHHIVRVNAGFFVRRFAAMHWSILTPELCIHWDGEVVRESAGATKADAPSGDPVEDVWKTYYRSIFNPARVKIGAMLSEMPRKYWKNMPETALIPELVAQAQARESGMIGQAAGSGDPAIALAALRAEASACTRCPLYAPATQTVFGEGLVGAPLMFVGEQPGDQEDLAGRPFVGPAGQLFDRALAEAGVDRAKTYVTNAVKHFKFEPQGKRRLHAKPNAGEIDACRWWLDQERAIVAPRVIVALGASAARGVLGKTVAVGKMRGAPTLLADGTEIWVTVHPSYLLRLPDPEAQRREYSRFVEDLRHVGARVAALSGSGFP